MSTGHARRRKKMEKGKASRSHCGCVPGKMECDTRRKLRLEKEHWQSVHADQWEYESYIETDRKLRRHDFEAHFSRKERNMLRQYASLSNPFSEEYHPNKAAAMRAEKTEVFDRAFELMRKEEENA